MMFQVKFVKPLTFGPAAKPSKKQQKTVSGATPGFNAAENFQMASMITVATFLGDDFFWGDVDLKCTLQEHKTLDKFWKSTKPIESQVVRWESGMRTLPIVFNNLSKKYLSKRFVTMKVEAINLHTARDGLNYSFESFAALHENIMASLADSGFTFPKPVGTSQVIEQPELRIYPVISMPVSKTTTVSDRHTLRDFDTIVAYEEMSNGIERHLWDAAIITCEIFVDRVEPLLPVKIAKKCRVLEVGAGIGFVSIYLSKLLNHPMLATDLEDAREISESNIEMNTPLKATFGTLDWEDDATDDTYDIIIGTDVTYNPTYFDPLLHVLQKRSTDKTTIVIAHKFREPVGELEFFHKMDKHFTLHDEIWVNIRGVDLLHLGVYSKK